MFFLISKTNDSRFDHKHYLSNGYVLNVDSGWSHYDADSVRYFYKGYSTTSALADIKTADDAARAQGNFVVLKAEGSQVQVLHPPKRSCLLYASQAADEVQVSNLVAFTERIPTDRYMTLDTTTHALSYEYYALYENQQPLRTAAQAVDEIYQIIDKKFKWLYDNVSKVKFFYSGGMDTLTCFSFLEKYQIPTELIVTEHFESSSTFDSNFRKGIRESLWGFEQMHAWAEPTWFVTGGNGDENFLRSPVTGNMWCLSHMKEPVVDLILPTDYHYLYFGRKHLPTSVAECGDVSDWQIVNMCANDHQHWHYENTTVFTPLDDINILKVLLKVNNPNAIVRQICDATLQKLVVAKNNTKLLHFLADQKNNTQDTVMKQKQFTEYALAKDWVVKV